MAFSRILADLVLLSLSFRSRRHHVLLSFRSRHHHVLLSFRSGQITCMPSFRLYQAERLFREGPIRGDSGAFSLRLPGRQTPKGSRSALCLERQSLVCTGLYCAVLYCAVPYCTGLDCTGLYWTVLCWTVGAAQAEMSHRATPYRQLPCLVTRHNRHPPRRSRPHHQSSRTFVILFHLLLPPCDTILINLVSPLIARHLA